jgi:hypothetical protein
VSQVQGVFRRPIATRVLKYFLDWRFISLTPIPLTILLQNGFGGPAIVRGINVGGMNLKGAIGMKQEDAERAEAECFASSLGAGRNSPVG